MLEEVLDLSIGFIVVALPLLLLSPPGIVLFVVLPAILLLALAAPLAGESWPARWGALSIASLLFQTVIVTFASYLAWFWLVRHYPATRIAAFTLLTPVAGLAAGVLLLGEPLTVRLMVALLAVVAGLALVNRH